jgi:hypothetical protein
MKKQIARMWMKSKTEEDRALHCAAKCNARKVVYTAQLDEQKMFDGMLESEFEKGTVFSVGKQMVGKHRDVVGADCVKGSDRKLVTGEAALKDKWEAYFDKLLNEEFEGNENGLTVVD